MLKQVKNEKGYNLLEILLSISLLSIVLLVFFGFFIQSSTQTVRNESSASAGQLSQEILEKVRNSNFHDELTSENWEELYSDLKVDSNDEFYIEVNNKTYYPKVYIEQDIGEYPFIPKHLELIRVVIEGNRNGERVDLFETYGYKLKVSI